MDVVKTRMQVRYVRDRESEGEREVVVACVCVCVCVCLNTSMVVGVRSIRKGLRLVKHSPAQCRRQAY